MPKEANLEFKVGVFVLAALVVFTGFILMISDFAFFDKGKKVQVLFGFANGLKKSAPVRLAGVEAGLVKDMKVIRDGASNESKVRIDIYLNEGIEVPVDSTFTVNQLGLLGEKYVEIMPGKSLESLAEGAVIAGHTPVAMDQILEKVHNIAAEMEQTMASINRGVLSAKNQKSLETTLEGISMIVAQVRDGQGNVGKLLYDDRIYNNLQELSADLKENPWKLLYRPKPKR